MQPFPGQAVKPGGVFDYSSQGLMGSVKGTEVQEFGVMAQFPEAARHISGDGMGAAIEGGDHQNLEQTGRLLLSGQEGGQPPEKPGGQPAARPVLQQAGRPGQVPEVPAQPEPVGSQQGSEVMEFQSQPGHCRIGFHHIEGPALGQ